MPMPASKRGFTLVEVLASIAAFTIVFLAGFGGIGKLLLTQDQNYARTLAASAAMLIADWHHRMQMDGTFAVSNLAKSITDASGGTVASDSSHLLFTVPVANVANVKWRGYDYNWTAANTPDTGAGKDTFYLFNSNPTLSLTAPATPITLNLANDPANKFTAYEYSMLLVSISPPSAKEADSKLTFRQISFWYGPPQILNDMRTSAPNITLELVGRFVIADTYAP